MRVAIFCGFVAVIALQAAQGDYITAFAIAILFILNEVILERTFHALKQHYKDVIASLCEDNDLLKNSLRIINLKLDVIRDKQEK